MPAPKQSQLTVAEAEEYTAATAQTMSGGYRHILLAEQLGVPKAMGLTTRQWVEQHIGGYIKMSIEDRRAAVRELKDEGHTTREIADVVGVGQRTVVRDLDEPDDSEATPSPLKTKGSRKSRESNDSSPVDVDGDGDEAGDDDGPSAVDEYLAADPHLQDLAYIKEYSKACIKAAAILSFDAERLGRILPPERIDNLDDLAKAIGAFCQRARQGNKLTAIAGGKGA